MNIVAHNLSAMNTQRMYGITSEKRAKATEKLSSGFKINRAADDAAGLSISEKMRKQIRGLTQGVRNTQDGISLCQVADGALAEVNEMLHRITELSVKAANETNAEQDRVYIQQEIQAILTEIDRIGNTTEFNDVPILTGDDEVTFLPGDFGYKFEDVKLMDLQSGKVPLFDAQNGDQLNFQAIITDGAPHVKGKVFNMIFSNGGTSDSTFRITDNNDVQTIVQLDQFTLTDYDFNGTDEWTRTYTYTKPAPDVDSPAGFTIGVIQKVRVEETSDDERNYVVSYEFSKSADVKNLEFLFHADTAYNNNDKCEGYYISGQRVTKSTIYSQANSPLTQDLTSNYVHNGTMISSFSIIDNEEALPFSEKISFEGGKEPDSVSLGNWSSVDQWNYYKTGNEVGQDMVGRDMGFALYYDMDDLTQDNSVTFKYGISKTETDPNLVGIEIKPAAKPIRYHDKTKSVWIQSGAEAGDGMYVTIEEMNAYELGIDTVDVTTVEGAERALDAVNEALKKLSQNRSTIGAEQNRLEHIVANEENIIENTTAAESQIRDTDMAKVMVEYSNLSILGQAGEAMMAQANQSNAGILTLLQ